MSFWTTKHALIFIWTLTIAGAFFPNPHGKYVNEDDYTHADITEIGILQAVASYFEENPPGGATISSGSLTGLNYTTARILYDKVYGGKRSPKRLQDAIDRIIRYNNKVDQDHYDKAAWHFNGEQINEAHTLMQDIRAKLLAELRKTDPDYELSREYVGQFLHILQMFYSNTNWIESNGQNMLPAIGQTGVNLPPTAPGNDTCKNCGLPCFQNDILDRTYLTSGYKSGQDIKKPTKDPNTYNKGKCSHGGPTDNSTASAATGGINKDTKNYLYSPHYYMHKKAAATAIEHTKYFFDDNTNGIRHVAGSDKFIKLLQLDTSHSLVFVIDKSGSMSNTLAIIAQETQKMIQAASTSPYPPANYILVTFSEPGTSTTVVNTTKSTDIINAISAIQAQGGDDCPEFSLTGIEAAANAANPDSIVYVFTDSTPKDPYKQDKVDSLIAEKRLRLYFIVTGTCSTTNQQGLNYSDNIIHVIGRKKRDTQRDDKQDDKVLSKNVLVHKQILRATEPPVVEVPIDSTISEFHIDIHGVSAMPYVVLQKPNNDYLNIDGNDATETRFHDNMVSISVKKPAAGLWRLFRFDRSDWEIEVSGKSTLDFEYNITSDVIDVQVHRGNYGIILYNLFVATSSGDIIQKIALNKIKDAENLYKCLLDNYQKDYVYGIEGRDGDGNLFQRVHHSFSTLMEKIVKIYKGHHRKRRSTSWDLMDVYRHLASVSGGHVFQTPTDQIPNAANILKSAVSGNEVLILNTVYPGGPSTPREISIDVDSSISQMTIKIHGKNNVPNFILKNSYGNMQPIDNVTVTMYTIGQTYVSIVVEKPRPGNWTIRKNDISEWDVEVTAQSTVDFSATFMKYDPVVYSYIDIFGRPIPDENLTLSIVINDKSLIVDLNEVSLLDIYGDEIAHYSLTKKDTKNQKGYYTTSVIIPHQPFKLAVIGTLITGGNFVRLHRDVILIVNIKLDHLPEKEPLFINEDLNVRFVVANAGSQDEDVMVTIEDDKNFVTGPKSRTLHLKAWTNQTGYFTVHGGKTEGEITTITLIAKPAAATRSNSKFQYILTHLTVEKRKLDTIPPVCNVTYSSISCTDPCKCQQYNAFITAEIWDEGDGLSEINAPNTPVNSLHLNGFSKGLVKSKGSVIATLTINCCRKNVTIDVVDKKNLTGACDIPIDPTYDIDACTTTTTSTSTVSTTTYSTTSPATTTTQATSTMSSTPSASTMFSSTTSTAYQTTTPLSTSIGGSSAKASSVLSAGATSTKVTTTTKSASSTVKTSAVPTTTTTPASTTTTPANPSASKDEENSSTLSDGAVYGIAAAVGAVTVAVVIGGVALIMKKMSAVSPKTET